ncbi:MAG: hypothetical protein U0Q21_13380 [Dermatophilaceae bacterium]
MTATRWSRVALFSARVAFGHARTCEADTRFRSASVNSIHEE